MSFSGWKETSWGEIATLEYGKSLRSYKESKGKIPVYGTNGLIGFTNQTLCNSEGVIVGRKGAYRGVHYSPEPFYVIDTAFYLKTNNFGLFDYKWAYYKLLTQNINSMDSGSAIPSTSRPDFYALRVDVPPLPEQKAIAATLSCLDNKIEFNNRINNTLEKMAQAIFKSWFVDFEPFQAGEFEESELGRIPKGWRVGSLGDIANITMGQSPSGSSYNEKKEGTVFYQGRTDFGKRYPTIRLYTTEPKRMATKGDILLSVRAPVGDINIASEDCCIGRGLASLKSKANCNSSLLYQLLNLKDKFNIYNGEGTVFGSINKDTLNNMQILIPFEKDIQEFQYRVGKLDEVIESNSVQIKILTTIRDALLPKLMSGEIRVPIEEVQ